jgi:spermidine/putrescine transport system permease protein
MMPKARALVCAAPVLLVLAVLLFAPLATMVFVSFVRRDPSGALQWGQFSSASYLEIFYEHDFLTGRYQPNANYLTILDRSLVYAGATTAITLMIGFPAALWVAALPTRSKNVVLLLMTLPFWTNLLVRLYAIIYILRDGGPIDAALSYMFPGFRGLDLLYSPVATVVGLCYSNVLYMIMPIFVSLDRIDRHMVEASSDLGANGWKTVIHVLLPLSAPGIVTGCILVFVPCLGSFIGPELLGGGKTMILGNLIEAQFGELRNWPLGAALSTVLLALLLLTYGAQRVIYAKRTTL